MVTHDSKNDLPLLFILNSHTIFLLLTLSKKVEGSLDLTKKCYKNLTIISYYRIEVCAILNDTTGCLMSSAWRDDRCRVGLILGTGTNACYLEEIEDIHTIDQNEFEGIFP